MTKIVILRARTLIDNIVRALRRNKIPKKSFTIQLLSKISGYIIFTQGPNEVIFLGCMSQQVQT